MSKRQSLPQIGCFNFAFELSSRLHPVAIARAHLAEVADSKTKRLSRFFNVKLVVLGVL